MERINRENKRASRQDQQQQTQRKGNGFFQSGQHLKCSNCGRNHIGHCFRVDGPYYTCGERGHIAKFCPKGDSGSSHATPQTQRDIAGIYAHTYPARIAL
ncbi:hypothetical protein P3L10_005258 [Capsicum annuum]